MFETILTEAVKGNYSFFILVVAIVQAAFSVLILLKERDKGEKMPDKIILNQGMCSGKTMKIKEQLPILTDLNNITVTGTYICQDNTVPQWVDKIVHWKPTNPDGIQEIEVFSYRQSEIYRRLKGTDGSYTQWQKIRPK